MKKQNKKPYKPYKFDTNKKRIWLKIYGQTYNISSSCQAVRISRQTFYGAIDRDPKFKERYKQVEEKLVDAVESKLYQEAIKEGTLGALIFILCNRRPNRWQNTQKQKIEVVGDEDRPLRIVYVPARDRSNKHIPKK